MSDMFDYQALAKRAGVEPKELSRLEACLRRQYGSDVMMFELRMLRTLQAVSEGGTTLAEAIREFSAELAR